MGQVGKALRVKLNQVALILLVAGSHGRFLSKGVGFSKLQLRAPPRTKAAGVQGASCVSSPHPPIDVHTLTVKIYANVTLPDKGKLRLKMELRLLVN